jgi:DNA-binding NtrC family response regulator
MNLHSVTTIPMHPPTSSDKRLLQQLLPGDSLSMGTLREHIGELASQPGSVLLLHEPGVDAHVVARAIHLCGLSPEESPGKSPEKSPGKSWRAIDGAVYSAECLYRELFGDGMSSPGLLDGHWTGTLFLDHIEYLPLLIQEKLQRLISAPTAKVRLIAATEAELATLVREGAVLDSLSRQVSQTTLVIPPLRARLKDITACVATILDRIAFTTGRPPLQVTVETIDMLCKHDWPGNQAELEQVIYRAAMIAPGPQLTPTAIRPWLDGAPEERGSNTVGQSLREVERMLIETTFNRCDGNREQTAKALKIGLRTLSGKLRDYGYPPRGGPGSNKQPVLREAA